MRRGSGSRSQMRRGSGGLVCQSKEEKEGALPPPKGEAGKAHAKGGKRRERGREDQNNTKKKAGKLSKYSKVRDR